MSDNNWCKFCGEGVLCKHILHERMRQISELVKTHQKEMHDACSHLQGDLGIMAGPKTAIVWHMYDDKVIRGICTQCNRFFVPEDSDYLHWFSMESGNTMSIAGRVEPLTDEEKRLIDKHGFGITEIL